MSTSHPQVLQLCHDYRAPFLYLSGQYAKLFAHTHYEVTTVFLKGAPDENVVKQCHANEVIFLNLTSKQIRGLKLRAIYQILKLHRSKQFRLCIAHRYQSVYIATLIPHLPVIGVHHDYIEYKRRSHRTWVNWHKKNLALLGVSNSVRDSMRDDLPDFPPEQIQTLYNTVNPQEMQEKLRSREQARKELGLTDHFWFVKVGRLHPLKDQSTLIRGFAKVAKTQPEIR